MNDGVEIHAHGKRGLAAAQPLWEALYDHHVAVGAAGLRTIPREDTWPRRLRHYEAMFAEKPNAQLWLATLNGAVVGYATAYEGTVAGERTLILETLSVLPEARGHGIGTRLMDEVDQFAKSLDIHTGEVDVLGGNARARDLYLRRGYAPYAEAWIHSTRPVIAPEAEVDLAGVAEAASKLGLRLLLSPGLDDTWDSAETIVDLSMNEDEWRGSESDFLELGKLFSLLVAAGLWTIRVDIPAGFRVQELRDFLRIGGFCLGTERLIARRN